MHVGVGRLSRLRPLRLGLPYSPAIIRSNAGAITFLLINSLHVGLLTTYQARHGSGHSLDSDVTFFFEIYNHA